MPNKKVSNDKVMFNINEVASIIDVVPATIRNWEKHGLFIAKRKPNNYRVYYFDDIDVLKKIKRYSIDERMGISAIKNLLITPVKNVSPMISNIDENKNNFKDEDKYSRKLLSKKWKQRRKDLNYTLEEVSKYLEISSSYLSKIENGEANISLNILNKLAKFYGESILYFFNNETDEKKVVQSGKGEQIEVVLDGVTMESLVSIKDHIIYPMIFKVKPGCGDFERHQHQGEEFVYILSGKLEVNLNKDEIYILKKGDSIYFKSNEEHSWKNIGNKDAKLLWVHSPVQT